jgi:hypothetical protein
MEQLPQDLQKLIGSPQTPSGDPSSAPNGAPMSTEQPKEGDKLNAKTQVTVAMSMLEQALMALGSHSEEGRVVMESLMKLSKYFHKEETNELVPAQLMSMMQSMPQVGGGSPEQMALMKSQGQPQQPQQPQPQQ